MSTTIHCDYCGDECAFGPASYGSDAEGWYTITVKKTDLLGSGKYSQTKSRYHACAKCSGGKLPYRPDSPKEKPCSQQQSS